MVKSCLLCLANKCIYIVFSTRTYLFEEFLNNWAEKLKAASATHMSVRLHKDIDTFKVHPTNQLFKSLMTC